MFTYRACASWVVAAKLVMFVLLVSVAGGQTYTRWVETAKLVASDGLDGDEFGRCVDIHDVYAICGAPRKDVNTGAAYVFRYDGANWTEENKLTASDGTNPDMFGSAAAMGSVDGMEYVLVGADSHNNGMGAVYAFERVSATDWPEQFKFVASDGVDADHFGHTVSLGGNGFAVIGSIYDDDNGSNSGSAYTFVENLPTWPEQSKVSASDGEVNDWYSMALCVSADGNYLIVGASGDDENGSNSGSAYIYKRGGYIWGSEVKITAPDGDGGDGFGKAAAINSDGSFAMVGASGDDDYGESCGAVYVFKREEDNWMFWCKLAADDAKEYSYFGESVDISGDEIIAGAWGDSKYAGAAYIFERQGSGWVQRAKLVASDRFEQDRFGISVAIDSGYAIVGAYQDEENADKTGSAYIFTKMQCPISDLDGDCMVDMGDLAVMAQQWLDYGE